MENEKMKTSNKNARQYVNERKDFKGSHTFGENTIMFYTVYSYGYHFPLYVYSMCLNVWYENTDKYSVTTSKHLNQLRPDASGIYKMTTQQLKDLIS